MFMNLVFADFIQALGFGMNYVWVKKADVSCVTNDCAAVCTFQGVLIQLGDLSSAYSNLMIAIQTYVILTFSWHLPLWSAWATIPAIWVIVGALAIVAPTVNGTWTGPSPFYTWTGAWCWINAEYGPLRLYLHYFWVFVAAFASIALYGHLFLRLRLHFRTSSRTRSLGALSAGDPLRKKIERKAQGMLMYPIGFIIMILPLSTYRLAALAGHDWGVAAAGVAGSMYCLSGFVDVLLFGITRSIIAVPAFGMRRLGNGGTMAVSGPEMSSSAPGGATRSAFRVQVVQETVIDLDTPTIKDYVDSSPDDLSANRNAISRTHNDQPWPIFQKPSPTPWYHPGGASIDLPVLDRLT
ncbi:hypothetical protein CROQUDRAFT_37848 [Cronartium quercuum f. sp. fusiforme G11]|uniref:G protein-coupled receptor GPR1/2/3 C-terminal domain-containing protein n=1 Tax=Cronartium quercuum f. sp. fusiforme G11 TaxID=708437 RepID=A0A9P6NP66_9BASI|nr:hypothetical protein CROQUDRAFT_37848 [Cronartium quercuum f. sp. fusiforme G11]